MEQDISKTLIYFDQVQTANAVITLLVPTQNTLNQNISVYTSAS